MKVENVASIHTDVSGTLRKENTKGKTNYDTTKDDADKKTAEETNYRLQKKIGFVTIPDVEEAVVPDASLSYEKTVDMDNYYLGKYLNIVV